MEASGGLTIPAHGVGGSWIVKLPSTQFQAVPESEYAMLGLARAAGITAPEIRLVPVGDIRGLPEAAARMKGNALVVERFDRAAGPRRIHMEDFAQVFGLFPDDKYGHRSYANIASVLWAETGQGSTYEFVRRLVFSVLIGNGDMHLKNWSLLYPDGRTPVLSPAYDFVATFFYIPGDKLALNFGGSQSLNEITVDQVRRFADRARLPTSPVWEIVREMVERTAAAWKTLDQKDILPSKMRKAIDRQIHAGALLPAYSERDDLRFSRHDLKAQYPVPRARALHWGESPMPGRFQRQRAKVRRAAGLQRGLCDIPRCIHRNSDNHRGFALNRVPGFGRDVGEHAARDFILCSRRDRRDRRDRRGSLRRSGLGRTEPGHDLAGGPAVLRHFPERKGQRVSRERPQSL